MSTISKDATQYRRNRGLQHDGQRKARHVTMVQRSHDRPVEEVNPIFVVPDTPDYGNEHLTE